MKSFSLLLAFETCCVGRCGIHTFLFWRVRLTDVLSEELVLLLQKLDDLICLFTQIADHRILRSLETGELQLIDRSRTVMGCIGVALCEVDTCLALALEDSAPIFVP